MKWAAGSHYYLSNTAYSDDIAIKENTPGPSYSLKQNVCLFQILYDNN